MIDAWPHPACLEEAALLRACVETRGRRGGPGGQHRNKVETHVSLTHRPTGVSAQAGERREHAANLRVAVFRLRLALATQVRVEPPVSRGLEALDGPWTSALWRSRLSRPARRGPGTGDALERLLGGALAAPGPRARIACNPEHRDYPALLAEALDVLAWCGWDPRAASERLGVSATQLMRLVQDHPPAWTALNAARQARGLHPLR